MKISIIGLGRLGSTLVSTANIENLAFYDIDNKKSIYFEKKGLGKKLDSISNALNNDIVFFAVHRDAVLNILQQNHLEISPATLLVNLSTFLTYKELIQKYKNLNFLSCKIIGESGQIQKGGKVAFIINQTENISDQKIAAVRSIFKNLGHVVIDDEDKYFNLNYLAAERIMRTALEFATELKNNSIPSEIIKAAILGVMIGTLEQYPYSNPDYFHHQIYQNNHDLMEIANALQD